MVIYCECRQAEVQLYGEGVPVDLSKAAVLYGQAADLGSPKAMMRLSALYRKGTGVELSQEKAFELIQKAASLDYAPAQAALGISYLEGRGVEKDENLGYDWIRKAAENGDALSRVMTCFLKQITSSPSKQGRNILIPSFKTLLLKNFIRLVIPSDTAYG